jgi:hypothetical protein
MIYSCPRLQRRDKRGSEPEAEREVVGRGLRITVDAGRPAKGIGAPA